MKFKIYSLFLVFTLILSGTVSGQSQAVEKIIDDNYDYLENLYKHLHANPELSLQEENTSAKLAGELRELGFSVTERVGGYGIVGVLKNGNGPVIMVRSDMDALPIREETGVPFASTQIATTSDGQESYVMHACGHDMHMTVMIGTARVLTELKDSWQGTLVFIGQPAEEIGLGAKTMIEDGLFERFPRPDYALAIHVNSALESGKVGIVPGYAYANVDNARIIVKGRGGHGAYPNLAIDPIIIASKLVLDFQTIVSREISALDPAVLSVGAIRGGSSANIIPNEVELNLTIRSFNADIRDKIKKRITEMADARGKAAGLPREEWPQVEFEDRSLQSVYNDPDLAEKMAGTFKDVLGEHKVLELSPVMYGEDFGWYGKVSPEIPILIYSVGSVHPEQFELLDAGSIDAIPSTHSSRYIPDLTPTLRTGVLTMSRAVLKLMPND